MTNTVATFGFGLAKIAGIPGKLIWLGQLLAGRPSKWQHAFLILPDDVIVEAEPGGAVVTSIDEYQNADGTFDCRLVYPPLTDDQKSRFAEVALSLKGTPYSILDYFSLALLHLHIRPNWVVSRVAATHHQICSQLVDYVYQQLGVQLFDDDRFAGDVMPSDLDHLADQKGW